MDNHVIQSCSLIVLLTFIWLPKITSQCADVAECDCSSTASSCDITSSWNGIRDDLPSGTTGLVIQCSAGGTLGSVQGVDHYSSLVSLSIKGCDLGTLGSDQLVSSSLQFLTIENNNIESINSQTFQQLRNLRELRITHEQMMTSLGSASFRFLNDLESLFVTDNSITEISPNAFQDLNNVHHIFLSRNQITDISPNTFALPLLTNLDLSDNRIVNLGADSFSGAVALNQLTLTNNVISTIEDGSLNLDSLSDVNLKDNHFKDLTQISFTPSLEILDLQNNGIQYMPQAFFTYFNNIQRMPIGDNPFHCNCRMAWMKQGMFQHDAKFQPAGQAGVSCHTPIAKVFQAYEPEEFSCREPSLSMDTSDVEDLTCVGEGDPAPSVIWDLPTGDVITTIPPADLAVYETRGTLTRGQFTSGIHTCTVRSAEFLNVQTRTLYVHAPPQATQPPTQPTIPPTQGSKQEKEECEYTQQELILTGVACGFGALTLCAVFGCVCLCHRRRKGAARSSKKKNYTKNNNQQQQQNAKQSKIADRAKRNSESSVGNNYSEYPQVSVFNKGMSGMSGSLRGLPTSSLAAAGLLLASQDGSQQNTAAAFSPGGLTGHNSASTSSIHATGGATASVNTAIPMTTIQPAVSVSSVSASVPPMYNTVRSNVYESLDDYSKEPPKRDVPEYTDLPRPGSSMVQNVAIDFGQEKPVAGSTVTYT